MDVMVDVDEGSSADNSSVWTLHAVSLLRFATLLVGPVDAADVVAIAFSKFFRLDRGEIRNPRAFLMRTVLNTSLDFRRSQRRRQIRDIHALLPTSVDPPESFDHVRRAVADLNVKQRAIVYFTYWEDLDATQIATLLGVTPGNVRRQLLTAQHRLRKALE